MKSTVIRVLAADDHALVLKGIRNVLDEYPDIELVGEARDGEEVIALTESLHPDVVLMDIAMPHINGVEATRQIKAHSPRTVVLVLTAYDDDAYVFALLEAGAAGYLLKSELDQQLASTIQSVSAGEPVLSPSIARKVVGRFANGASGRGPAAATTLTGRELEVLRLAAGGLPNRAIANRLALSPRTVQLHLGRTFEKLDVGSRTEAVVAALKHGWLRLEEIE
jgi:two-component system, NarL family, response regulator LiaR